MKSILKVFGVVFGIIVIALAGIILYATTLDPNDYKGYITDKFQAETGRSLELDGDIGLTFYPWLVLELNGVTVGNAPGFGDEPFLHADHALVRIKLLPLLREQYEVDTVRLHGAVVNLARNAEGVTNWEDLATEPREEEPGAAQLPLAAVVLGGVDIRDARFTWRDQTTGAEYDVSNLMMSTGELVYGEPVRLELRFDAAANQPELSAGTELTATFVYDLDNQRYDISPLALDMTLAGPNVPGGSADVDLRSAVNIDLENDTLAVNDLVLEALGTRISGSLAAAGIQSPEPSIEMNLDAAGDDLAVFFRIAEIEPLATQIAGLRDRSFNLSSAVSADMAQGNLAVSGLQASLLGADISGDIQATDFQSDAPAVHGALKASGPDLPTLMQVLGQVQGGSDAALATYGRQLSRIGSKSFAVNAEFDADLDSGNINVPVLSVDGLGVAIEGRLAATGMQGADGAVKGQLQVSAGRLKELLAALDQPELAEVAQSFSLNADVSGDRGNISISPMNLNLTLAGPTIPNSPVDMTLAADTRLNLAGQTLTLDNLNLGGLGLKLGGRIEAAGIFETPEFNGTVEVAPFNLRRFMQQLNQELPETADPAVFERVALSTAFDGSAGHLNISKLALALDETSVDGSLSVTDFDQPAIEFGVNIDQINVDRYLPPESAGQTQPVTPETAAGAAAQLPVETLRSLNTRGDLKIGRLTVSGANMSDVALSLNARDGNISLSPVAANLYQGTYKGDVNLDATGEVPAMSFKSALQGVNIEPLMVDFMGASSVSGIGNVEIALTARGENADAMTGTLNGSGNIALAEGVLKGIDVARILEQVEIMIESKRLVEIDRGTSTAFDTFTSTLQVNNGVVTSNDLTITAPGFQVTGRGTVIDLNDETLNYNLVATADQSSATRGEERYNIGGYSIPIQCQGQVEAPRCVPDLNEVIKVAVQREVQQKLGEVLQRALGGEKAAPAQPSNQAQDPATQEGGETQQQTEPVDPRQELIEKALKGIFN